MARRRSSEINTGSDHDEVISWYWDKLSAPAVFPWAESRWVPETVGPTWKVDKNGYWILPEASIGWDVLGWAGCSMQINGKPWRYTLEQARWLLWWYSLDESGTWTFYDGILQRLKGWGKDPMVATLSGTEAFGPCRFGGWDANGHPIAVDLPDSWVQVAATALDQTKNTFKLFPGLFTDEAMKRHRINPPGKETVYANNDRQFIQAVTRAPTKLEGNRGTFIVANETQHWDDSNKGFDMADVIDRNATKSPDGAARRLAITNAPDPSKDSVGLRDREAWEQANAGNSLTVGIMYDSVEAPPDAPLTATDAPDVLAGVRGDSTWLNIPRIVKSILDTRNTPSRSRRFFYNQLTAAEDSWLDPQDIGAISADIVLETDEPSVMFFDGSKSNDATGVVTCRLSDGALFTSGIWQKPTGGRGDNWVVPRYEVDRRVRQILDKFAIVALFADPSHAKDDEALGYWDATIDGWHRDYHEQFEIQAVAGGSEKHSVMWDMTSPERSKLFTKAAEQFVVDVEDSAERKQIDRPEEMVVVFDGHPMMRQHLRNAKEAENRYGTSLRKAHRQSPRKIDLAVCAVGARMLRRLVLNRRSSERPKKKQPGKVW